MTTEVDATLAAQRHAWRAALDRLVPPVDDLPGAGDMGLLDDMQRMSGQHPRYAAALARFGAALATAGQGVFAGLDGAAQDAALRQIEGDSASDFALVLELVYLAYYGRPDVHKRIGWRSGPLQPEGFALQPFDPAVLETVQQRLPLWRPAPD